MITLEEVMKLLADRRHKRLNDLQLLYGDLALKDYAALKHHLDEEVRVLREEQKLYRLGDDDLTYALLVHSAAPLSYRLNWKVDDDTALPPAWSHTMRQAFIAFLDDLDRAMPRAASDEGQNVIDVHFLSAGDRFAIYVHVRIDQSAVMMNVWELFEHVGLRHERSLRAVGFNVQAEQTRDTLLWKLELDTGATYA